MIDEIVPLRRTVEDGVEYFEINEYL